MVAIEPTEASLSHPHILFVGTSYHLRAIRTVSRAVWIVTGLLIAIVPVVSAIVTNVSGPGAAYTRSQQSNHIVQTELTRYLENHRTE